MDIPQIAKGFIYPSSRVTRCPRFHRCQVTNKCQSFDKTRLECKVCESRVRPAQMVGGVQAEGEFTPDMQESMKIVRDALATPMADPNREGQKIDGYDISRQYDKVTRATEIMQRFRTEGVLRLTEQVTDAYYNPETKRLLGRLE